jgi:transposase
MINTNITTEEKEIIKKHLKTSPLVLVRLKSHALLARHKGVTVNDIADITSRSEKTVSRWLKEWREKRLGSLFTGHQGNENAGKLTRRQKEEIQEALRQPPSAYGIPQEFWDVPALKQYTQARFDVVYESTQSYHFLLTFSNLSFKYPDTFDRHRDEAAITARMAEIRAEITPLLQNPDWEVFAADEVRLEKEAFTRRAWLKRGERTIIKVDRKREAQNYLGLLNQRSFRCYLEELEWQNQKQIIKVLTRVLKKHPAKKVAIIWDNARFHKGKEIRKELGREKALSRVHLIPLPPYAPDKNPIEHVWNTAKGSLANVQKDHFRETKTSFAGYVRRKKFNYQI